MLEFCCFSRKNVLTLNSEKTKNGEKHQKCFLNYKFARERRKNFQATGAQEVSL